MIGRPDSYTPEIGDKICQRIVEGESVRSICRDEDMPNASTVFRWLSVHKSFSEQYARAKEEGAEALAEEMFEIADDGHNDWMERNGKDDAGWVANGENLQRSRLRVDVRKWYLSKIKPKKYGDKIQTELTGSDGGPVQISHIERVIIDPHTKD